MPPRFRFAGYVAAVTLAAALCPARGAAQELSIAAQKKVLDNGLTILVVERDTEPTATCWLFYKTGSVNERPGITGISHLFEHMMFKGTRVMGVKDAARDQELMATLDALWQKRQAARGQVPAELMARLERARQTVKGLERQIAEGEEALQTGTYRGQQIPPAMRGFARGQLEEGKKELATARAQLAALEADAAGRPELAQLQALDAEWEVALAAERANVVKDELWETYLKNGATGLNAFTSYDVTAYIVTLPATKTELFMWLESDRMAHAVFREFYSERDVVKEERRLMENRPLGLYEETMDAMFFQAHPYSWPVLGWMSDLDAITRRDLQDYFDIHYAPNNAVLVVVGRVSAETIFAQAERSFGGLPRGKPKLAVRTVEPEQIGEKRFAFQADANPQIDLWYHTPAIGHPDVPPLMLLGDILSGKTGRLYQRLVEKEEAALRVAAGIGRPRQYPASFSIEATCKGDVAPETLERLIDEELARVQQEGVSARELQRAQNQHQAQYLRGLRSNQSLTAQLGFAESIYRWEYLNEAPKLFAAVTVEDVQRVARQYLVRTNRLVGLVTRKPKAEEAAPAPGPRRLNPLPERPKGAEAGPAAPSAPPGGPAGPAPSGDDYRWDPHFFDRRAGARLADALVPLWAPGLGRD